MGADGKRGLDPELVPRTVDAICAEIENSPFQGWPAKTVFFGGGTPTFLNPPQLSKILDTIFKIHPPSGKVEVTSEANPGTVDSEKFIAMKQIGFNRLSLGVQSFENDDLIRLGRVHLASEAESAYHAARNAGFENINLDLMFALPHQNSRNWEANLQKTINLRPEHLSLYCLTIEPGTAFKKKLDSGELLLPDHDAQAEMYDLTREKTKNANYQQYEISNFATPGFECEHNLAYWQGEYYAGYGPGAVSFLPQLEPVKGISATIDLDPQNSSDLNIVGSRKTRLKHPSQYCSAIERNMPLYLESETIDATTHRVEKIMLGIRLNNGIQWRDLNIDPRSVEKLVDRGWATSDQSVLNLTPIGQALCSEATLILI